MSLTGMNRFTTLNTTNQVNQVAFQATSASARIRSPRLNSLVIPTICCHLLRTSSSCTWSSLIRYRPRWSIRSRLYSRSFAGNSSDTKM